MALVMYTIVVHMNYCNVLYLRLPLKSDLKFLLFQNIVTGILTGVGSWEYVTRWLQQFIGFLFLPKSLMVWGPFALTYTPEVAESWH